MSKHHLEESFSKTLFGFWTYLMTDCILFATLFATYAVLHEGTFGGPSSQDLFDLPFALTETLILLVSSFTCGLGKLYAFHLKKTPALLWFLATFLLGIAFLALELHEFMQFHTLGYGWERSAFLSSFFTLVGTHGAHITIGLLWMLVLMIYVGFHTLSPVALKRLTCFSFFWHFLDVVWIFIFTYVYLMGV